MSKRPHYLSKRPHFLPKHPHYFFRIKTILPKRPQFFIAKTACLKIFIFYSNYDIMCDVLYFKICPVNLYIVYTSYIRRQVSSGNFDNKEFSIAIFICIFKSRATTFPVYISESGSRLTKEGPKPINVYKQCLPRK